MPIEAAMKRCMVWSARLIASRISTQNQEAAYKGAHERRVPRHPRVRPPRRLVVDRRDAPQPDDATVAANSRGAVMSGRRGCGPNVIAEFVDAGTTDGVETTCLERSCCPERRHHDDPIREPCSRLRARRRQERARRPGSAVESHRAAGRWSLVMTSRVSRRCCQGGSGRCDQDTRGGCDGQGCVTS
jgi:hypothetical protein